MAGEALASAIARLQQHRDAMRALAVSLAAERAEEGTPLPPEPPAEQEESL